MQMGHIRRVSGTFLLRNGLVPAFHAGAELLLSVLLGMRIHMTIVTVVIERKEKTLHFIMNLHQARFD